MYRYDVYEIHDGCFAREQAERRAVGKFALRLLFE